MQKRGILNFNHEVNNLVVRLRELDQLIKYADVVLAGHDPPMIWTKGMLMVVNPVKAERRTWTDDPSTGLAWMPAIKPVPTRF